MVIRVLVTNLLIFLLLCIVNVSSGATAPTNARLAQREEFSPLRILQEIRRTNTHLPQQRIWLGSDMLALQDFAPLQGKRVGLITNPSGVNRSLRISHEILSAAKTVKLVALFAPEHGINGDIFAGDEVQESIHQATGLPVRSLYGRTRTPTPQMLKDIDVLVYDLQDLGCRSYTFISTLGMAMEACGAAGVEFVVLDRPNPLGGVRVEGPMLDPKFRSFVGRWNVPYVYGMTPGELARMIVGEGWITNKCKLTVVPMSGWKRSMVWKDTGLVWIPTSPRVPRGDSPLFYASTGVLGEIGGVQIGMKWNRPFECIAAPWLDADAFCRQMNSYGMTGVQFVPFRFKDGQVLQQGAEIRYVDFARAPLTAINYYALDAVKKTSGRSLFQEALEKDRSFNMFDKVTGGDETRLALQNNKSAESIVRSWKAGEEAFRKKREKYLIYQ
jgi:uncharacterized protein YbbC (DUF1343 family)